MDILDHFVELSIDRLYEIQADAKDSLDTLLFLNKKLDAGYTISFFKGELLCIGIEDNLQYVLESCTYLNLLYKDKMQAEPYCKFMVINKYKCKKYIDILSKQVDTIDKTINLLKKKRVRKRKKLEVIK
jgi:hypothetical protein